MKYQQDLALPTTLADRQHLTDAYMFPRADGVRGHVTPVGVRCLDLSPKLAAELAVVAVTSKANGQPYQSMACYQGWSI